MKVVAFNGSPKKEGNTYYALKLVADELIKEGIEVEIVHVGNKTFPGCMSCFKCRGGRCAINNDPVNEWIEKIEEADGILLGSPTYFSNISGPMKSFLDRAFFAMKPAATRHKVGAAVTAVRRSGEIGALDAMNRYISYSEMFTPGANYWNMIHGMQPGDAQQDEEGKQIMRVLGANMAYFLKMKEAAKEITPPAKERKILTNFVR